MSWIANIRNSSPKKKHYIAIALSSFLLLMIILIWVFWYEAPYKKTIRPEYNLSNASYFRSIFRNAGRQADSFVEPVDQYFRQQNTDNSSEF